MHIEYGISNAEVYRANGPGQQSPGRAPGSLGSREPALGIDEKWKKSSPDGASQDYVLRVLHEAPLQGLFACFHDNPGRRPESRLERQAGSGLCPGLCWPGPMALSALWSQTAKPKVCNASLRWGCDFGGRASVSLIEFSGIDRRGREQGKEHNAQARP